MSRRRTKKEDIRNPENYFNRYIALEVKHDLEEQNEYYEMFESLDKLQENLERTRGDAQLYLAVNTDGSDLEKALSERSVLAWIDYIDNPLLFKAIKELSIRDQYLISLRYNLCLTQREVATVLSISQSAVAQREKKIFREISKIAYQKS